MIIENIHILSFPHIYQQINTRKKLGFNLVRLHPDQITTLQDESINIMNMVVKALPEDIAKGKILCSSTNAIAWTQLSSDKISMKHLNIDYKFKYDVYAKGILISMKEYVLWNGSEFHTMGTILSRNDVASVCKHLFNAKMKDLFFGTDEYGEFLTKMKELPIDAFVFKKHILEKNRQYELKILDSKGKYNDNIPLDVSSIPFEGYIQYTAKRIQVLQRNHKERGKRNSFRLEGEETIVWGGKQQS